MFLLDNFAKYSSNKYSANFRIDAVTSETKFCFEPAIKVQFGALLNS